MKKIILIFLLANSTVALGQIKYIVKNQPMFTTNIHPFNRCINDNTIFNKYNSVEPPLYKYIILEGMINKYNYDFFMPSNGTFIKKPFVYQYGQITEGHENEIKYTISNKRIISIDELKIDYSNNCQTTYSKYSKGSRQELCFDENGYVTQHTIYVFDKYDRKEKINQRFTYIYSNEFIDLSVESEVLYDLEYNSKIYLNKDGLIKQFYENNENVLYRIEYLNKLPILIKSVDANTGLEKVLYSLEWQENSLIINNQYIYNFSGRQIKTYIYREKNIDKLKIVYEYKNGLPSKETLFYKDYNQDKLYPSDEWQYIYE